jgi:clan AA aspartic protease (TIGR02281 family)
VPEQHFRYWDEKVERSRLKDSDAGSPRIEGESPLMAQAFGLQNLILILIVTASLLLSQPATLVHAGAFEDGKEFFQGGHYRWALEKFVEAVDQSPRDPERQWYLGESYRLLGDNAAAAHTYRQILQLAPQSPQAMTARRALDSLGEPSLTTFQIPFERRGTAVLIPGRANGQLIGYFILDTGATFTTVSRAAADRLGVFVGGSSVRLATANGAIQVPLVLLDELEVGGAIAHHVAAVVHDLPSLPTNVVGLLGLSFLDRFRVSLNLSSGVLTLEAGE